MRVCLLLLACACLPGLTKDLNTKPVHLLTTQYPSPSIVGSGAPNPGQTIRFDLFSFEGRGRRYQIATSLGPGPIRIGPHRLPLSIDPVFLLSISGRAPTIFQDYAGSFDERGTAVARLHLPRGRALIGLRLHTAFVTLTSATLTTGTVLSVSPAFVFPVAKA